MARKTVTVHIPLYNEEANLPAVFSRIASYGVAPGILGLVSPSMPVRNTCTKSARSVVGSDESGLHAKQPFVRPGAT